MCIAAPRVDVILELEPRLRAAFPTTPIHALYGGAKTDKTIAQLILATTHQLYRFQHAFDVIFVDEADAFPYTADETLTTCGQKSSKTKRTNPFRHRNTIGKTHRRNQTNRKSLNDKPAIPWPSTSRSTVRHVMELLRQIKKKEIPQKLNKWTKERLAK